MTAGTARIVHYVPRDGSAGDCIAAIVTAANEDGSVALHPFYPPGANHVAQAELESVPESSGATAGHWHWPEHVPGERPGRF